MDTMPLEPTWTLWPLNLHGYNDPWTYMDTMTLEPTWTQWPLNLHRQQWPLNLHGHYDPPCLGVPVKREPVHLATFSDHLIFSHYRHFAVEMCHEGNTNREMFILWAISSDLIYVSRTRNLHVWMESSHAFVWALHSCLTAHIFSSIINLSC